MSKLIQIYRQILEELKNKKKLASKLNEKNVKMDGGQDIKNYGHNNE